MMRVSPKHRVWRFVHECALLGTGEEHLRSRFVVLVGIDGRVKLISRLPTISSAAPSEGHDVSLPSAALVLVFSISASIVGLVGIFLLRRALVQA